MAVTGPRDSNDMIVDRDVMVRVRDGIRLATDVYRPASTPGPFPVILERTPYGKAEPSPRESTAADPSPRPRAEVAAYTPRRSALFALSAPPSRESVDPKR